MLFLSVLEPGAGGEVTGSGTGSGSGPAARTPAPLSEGPGDGRHEAADAGTAGGVPEPAGHQAHAGHGDQRLSQDVGGGGEAVRTSLMFSGGIRGLNLCGFPPTVQT